MATQSHTTFMPALSLVMLFLVGCLTKCPEAGKEGLNPPRTFLTTTRESSEDGTLGFVFSVEGETHIHPGGPILVRAELKNTAGQEFSFVQFGDLPNEVSLKMPDGGAATLTDYGQELFGQHSFSSVPTVSIKTSLSHVWVLDIRRIFNLPVPGTYSLRVGQPINFWTGTETKTIDVNETVRFEVDRM